MNCVPMSDQPPTSKDRFLGGQLILRQPLSGHRAGHDAILLAAATPARAGNRVVEFGAGVGAAGLALARRIGEIDLVLVEIDKQLAQLARTNAAANAIEAAILVEDVTATAARLTAAGLAPDSVDVVLMNPPFNHPSRHRPAKDESRRAAHMANASTLEDWVATARRLLKSGGMLTLIWRADGLSEVVTALDRGFGSLVMLPVHGDPAKPAIRLIVCAVKGGRGPTRIQPGLLLNDAAGKPSEEAETILSGGAGLRLTI